MATNSGNLLSFRCSEQLDIVTARAKFFAHYGFGADGGYEAQWVGIRIGWIRLVLPNTPGRVRAMPRHDLHHILTGYPPDWRGETFLAAWELASGHGRYWTARLICLWAFALGLLAHPRQLFRAFREGRKHRSLYTLQLDPWDLAYTLSEVKSLTRIRRSPFLDWPLFLCWSAISQLWLLGMPALILAGLLLVLAAG